MLRVCVAGSGFQAVTDEVITRDKERNVSGRSMAYMWLAGARTTRVCRSCQHKCGGGAGCNAARAASTCPPARLAPTRPLTRAAPAPATCSA